jgi:hypothetical protein
MRIGLATAGVGLVLVTGCGSHDSAAAPRLPGPTHSGTSEAIGRAFWAKTDLFCRPFLVYENRHPSIGPPGMNPYHPTKAQLSALLAQARRTHDPYLQRGVWKTFVQRVGMPASGVDLWRPIAHDFLRYDVTGKASRRAVLAGDGAAFGRAYRDTNTVLARLAVDLGAAQPPSANACEKIFG